MKKIGTYALAQPFAVGMAIIGFICGILYSFGGAIYDWVNGQLGFGTVLAFMAIVGMPIMFATAGFIVGLISTFLYNLFAE